MTTSIYSSPGIGANVFSLLSRVLADPVSGSFYAPTSTTSNPDISEPVLVMNRSDAECFLADSQELLKRLREKSPLLSPIQSGLWSCRWPEMGNGNRVILESKVNHKTLYMDVGQSSLAQYALGFRSAKGHSLQNMGIDQTSFEVSTISYACQVPCLNFDRVTLTASGLCRLIYFSETYQGITHLGDLCLHHEGTVYPIPIDYESKAISFPPLVPNGTSGFMISSSLVAQQYMKPKGHPSTLTMRAVFDEKMDIWRLVVQFYRPSEFSNSLMPLRNGLLGLWNKMQETICQNGTDSTKNNSRP